jgi:hypothetical protein
MAVVRFLVIAIALVALMVVAIFATMLPVAQIMAACDGMMTRLLLFGLFLLFDLFKDADCFIGSLTLLEKGNEPKRVRGHHLVCLLKLVLMCLGLHKEDLLARLLRCEKLHCLMDVATIKVAEELYLTLHELMH